MYDKVFLDTIRFTDYKLEFTNEEIFCINNGNFNIEPIEFNSLLNVCETTITLGDNLWNVLNNIKFTNEKDIYSNLVPQIQNNQESQKLILEWLKKYGLKKYEIVDDELDYNDLQYKEFDNLLQETAKKYFNIKEDIRFPIFFNTKIHGVPKECYSRIYKQHKWNITNLVIISLTMSALIKIKKTLYKTTIIDIVKIINASDTLKSGYEKMRKKEYKVYTKTFGNQLSSFANILFSELNKYVYSNSEKNVIDVELNQQIELDIKKKNSYKLFNNNYIMKDAILGAYEYFLPMILTDKISTKKERKCDRCNQKLIYRGRLCVKCKKIIGGELILEDRISNEKMALVKKEMELLKIGIIPKTHIIDDIYYQRLRSQKNYNAKKMSNQ